MTSTQKFTAGLLAVAMFVALVATSHAAWREQLTVGTLTVEQSATIPTVTGNLVGNVTGTITGSSSLNLLLTGGTMTGPIKQRSGGAAVFPNISATKLYGPVTGAVTGNVTGDVTGTASGNLALTGGTVTGDTTFGDTTTITMNNGALTVGGEVTITKATISIGGETFGRYSDGTLGVILRKQ